MALYQYALTRRATAGPWFHEAADQEVPEACWEMGMAYGTGGCGLNRDPDYSEHYLMKGAELGEPRCQVVAARYYEFQLPQEHPDPIEISVQARVLRQMVQGTPAPGRATYLSEAQILELHAQAHTGDAWAAYLAGIHQQDMEQRDEAKRWLLKAGAQGLAPAQWRLVQDWGEDYFLVACARQHQLDACYRVTQSPGAMRWIGPAGAALALWVCFRDSAHEGAGEHDWDDILLRNVHGLSLETLGEIKCHLGAALTQTGGGINTVEQECCRVYQLCRARCMPAMMAMLGCFRRGAMPGLSSDTVRYLLVHHIRPQLSKWLPL